MKKFVFWIIKWRNKSSSYTFFHVLFKRNLSSGANLLFNRHLIFLFLVFFFFFYKNEKLKKKEMKIEH